jgi:hypothetical protein
MGRSAANTRARILEAAYELFLSQGLWIESAAIAAKYLVVG